MNAPALQAEAIRPEKPLLRLREVDKIYANGTVALSKLDLDVAHNEFISLLGPSGCGKSTALRIIAGLSSHTAGMIDWPTTMHDVHGEPEREISFVFQEPQLMPWATIEENVSLPLRLKKVPKAEIRDRVNAMLELVSLQGFASAYPRQLSGGMKMRASIARALVTEPKLLLMDEPFAALDEITRNRLSNDLLEIWARSSSTVLFATHSIYESVFLSSRIVVMAPRPGRVVGMLDVPAAYPRGSEYRQTPEYRDRCAEVSGLLALATAP